MTRCGHRPHRARHRHRRAHAERPRLVAGGGDDAARCGRAADGDRLAAQLRVVALLDGRVERVHVDVEDAAHRIGDWRLTVDDYVGATLGTMPNAPCSPGRRPVTVFGLRTSQSEAFGTSGEGCPDVIVNRQPAIVNYPYASVLYRSFGTPISFTAAETVSMKRGVGSTPFSRAAARSWEERAGPQA